MELVIESYDENTSYKIEYAYSITDRDVLYTSFSSDKTRSYVRNNISTFTTGNSNRIDAVTFTVSRTRGNGTCIMYIIDEHAYNQYNYPLWEGESVELTDDVMQWVKTHYEQSCTLQPNETEASVSVHLK
jgi:hypothetical protein